MSSERRRPVLKLIVRVTAVVLALVICAVLFDLFYPRKTSLREFDSDEVARLETAMWRSYYEKQRVRLFNDATELLRTQYHLTPVKSNVVAYYAANAAFVFKAGKQRSDYEKALPDLIKFYNYLHNMSDIDFDVDKVSRLELEWWIIHRERENHAPGDLARALAELQAAIYNLPVERMMEHGRLRAEAMTIRDTKAERGGVTEADWAKINDLLRQSWSSLARAVKN
ncbi:MAG TPA: hypothetical protein VHQ64_15965 [Pyrinomonadaceae bacterium]|jgi:hypothetical protein|nr:hypothetical protein [Pyrinomonadaceae bacterium]